MGDVTCSVIVPTHNRAAFLPACIESVLGAGIPGLELLVVDDGSTDGTASVAARYQGSIRYVVRECGGASAARNTGVAQSTGRYIAFLDSDDTFIPGVHARMLGFLEEHGEVDAVFADVLVHEGAGASWRGHADTRFEEFRQAMAPAGSDRFQLLDSERFLRYQVLRQNTVLVQTAVVRRPLVERCGMFDETLRGYEEWEFFTRLAVHGAFAYLDEPCAVIEKHGGNISANVEAMVRYGIVIRRRFLSEGFGLSSALRAEARPLYERLFLDWSLDPFRRDDPRETRRRLSRFIDEVGLRPRAAAFWLASWLPPAALRGLRSLKSSIAGRRES